MLKFFKRHFSQSWRVAHTKFSRFSSVAITMALAPASEQSSLYSESNIAKHHWDVRISAISLIGFEPRELHAYKSIARAYTAALQHGTSKLKA